jgi:hypothetical protein
MCKTRWDAKIHPRRKLRMQSSRTDGDSSSTRPSMRDSGQPEDWKDGNAGGQEDSGRPGDSPLAQPVDARPGETQGTPRRRSRRSGDSGRPGDSPPAPLKDARREETQISITGTAEGRTLRGNPGIRRRSSRTMQTRGNPGMRSRNKRKIEEPGKLGASSQSWTGRCMIR